MDPQVRLLRQAACDRILAEAHAGANLKRPELENLLTKFCDGDTVVVKLDLSTRSLDDLLSIVSEMGSRGVQIRSLQDPLIDATRPNEKLVFGIFDAQDEDERDLIRTRTIEGLAAARPRGKRLDRREALNRKEKEKVVFL